jgi:hypothetical protein
VRLSRGRSICAEVIREERLVRYGGIQGFAGLFMIALVCVGFVQAGWRGVLTAILASWNAWPAIARQEPPPAGGTVRTPTALERGQRLGGVTGAVLVCIGLVHGGWRMGWAWGAAGYVLGLALGFVAVALMGVIRRPREPRQL